MNTRIANFFRFTLLAAFVATGANAATAPNPRGGATNVAPQRAEGRDVKRVGAANDGGASAVSRSATRRPNSTSARSNATVVNVGNNSVAGRSAVRQNAVPAPVVVRGDATNARAAASNVVRSAVSHSGANTARSASNMSPVSRASTARATAVFEDISKIGGGYANCREAYATCMDQFCAKANDTYRRCFCSQKFAEFRDTENALEEAKILLMRFEDNNLNAVDKTAAEVNAMYSATAGEMAIKNDTSGAAAMLSQISDLLSGKTKAGASNNSSTSLGILSFDFSTDMDDVWAGGGDVDSIFSNGGQDLTTLEGQALYNAASKQCLKLIDSSCESTAVLTMAKSAYSIMISQDCNAYEKKVNSQRATVEQTVRTAEKYLREARLEEYRAHNSADVNECIAKVKEAITADTACGANYKRCLDYSGVYIDANTGEAIYSPRLFQLQEMINLDGSADVLGNNAQFNKFLDTKYMFAQKALDTCRDQADIVWTEFKRSALIEIAQAQDAKIEEVKSSCVSTMAQCYDTQSNALKEFDNTTAQAAGALSAYAAKAMCQDKVAACAALYGGNGADQCNFDSNGRLTNAASCGLPALLAFVDTVDEVRVAEGCATAIEGYVKELCTPTAGEMKFPWNCRRLNMRSTASGEAVIEDTKSVEGLIKRFAVNNCSDPTSNEKSYAGLPVQTVTQVEKAIGDIEEQLDFQLMDACEALDGYWLDASDKTGTLLTKFYADAFGGSQDAAALSVGRCVENTVKVTCENYNEPNKDPVATYDPVRDECNFTEEWYQSRCAIMGNGYFENGVCYVAPSE